ncbi:MAG: helix-turn-helix domain-containing protein [Gordonia sp. (in: high G+C Gram-positive bacteria)]
MTDPTPPWTDPHCPVARTLDVVGDRWSLLIVRDAMDGARSFTDFQQRTSIARNILTDRLRKLIDHGVVEQTQAPSGKRKVYQLTDTGHDLFTVILAMRQWGERHAFADGELRSSLVDDQGALVPPIVATNIRGEPVNSANTTVAHVT